MFSSVSLPLPKLIVIIYTLNFFTVSLSLPLSHTHAKHHCQLMGTLWHNGIIKTSIYIFLLLLTFLDFWSTRFFTAFTSSLVQRVYIFIATILPISVQWYLLRFAIACFAFCTLVCLICCQKKSHYELRKILYNFNRLKICHKKKPKFTKVRCAVLQIRNFDVLMASGWCFVSINFICI